MGFAVLIAAISCQKEQDVQPESKEVTEKENPEVLPVNIPATLTASIVDTKTSYDENGKFSWVTGESGDIIYLMFYNTSEKKQGWIKYQATSADANGKAIFTIVSGQGSRITAIDGYVNSGVAIYGKCTNSSLTVARPIPAYVTTPYNTLFDQHSEYAVSTDAFITLRSSLNGDSSEVVLIGKGTGTKDEAGVFTDFQFYSACAVLRVTVTGIPAEAKELRLCTNDKENYPLSGDFIVPFIMDPNGIPEVKVNYYRQYEYDSTYENSSDDYIKASVSGSASQTFYFNVPTGDYPAGMLSLKLVDTNDNELLAKKINTDVTFARNDEMDVEFANQWTTLGVGKFIDNFLWAKMVASNRIDKDSPSYVDVTIQQNVANPNQFRLVNPYGAAAQKFGYTRPYVYDKYFVFTVAGASTGNPVTGFSVHRTGFNMDSNHNPELVYAKEYDSNYQQSDVDDVNKVILGNGTLPQIVQLAPVYRYNDNRNSAYHYGTDYNMNRKGVFRIIFPEVSGYDGLLSLAADCTARLDKISWNSGGKRIRMIVSPYTDYEIAAPKVNNFYIGKYPGFYDAAGSTGTWSPNEKKYNTSFPSGPVYITWFIVDNSDENYIYNQGRIKAYYLNTNDYNFLCKQHSIYSSASGLTYGTMTFAVSDDPANSNIKLIEFDGMEPTPDFNKITSNHRIFSAFGDWIIGTQYPYDETKLLPGEAMYGICSNGSISLDATKPFFKYGTESQNGSIYIFSTGKDGVNYAGSLDFSYDNSYNITSVSSSNCNLRARFWGYSGKWSGENGGTLDYVKSQVTTVSSSFEAIDMSSCTVTANSTQQDSSVSNLTDGILNTHWHSIWNGTRQYDDDYGVYINIQLPNAVSKIQVKYYTRHDNSNGCPREVVFWGSIDGSNWNKIGDNISISTKTVNTLVTLPTLEPESAISYLRMGITKYGSGDTPGDITSSSGFTAIAELMLYEVN